MSGTLAIRIGKPEYEVVVSPALIPIPGTLEPMLVPEVDEPQLEPVPA